MDAIQFLNSFNWQTIIGMFVISWYFTHDIKKLIEAQTSRLDQQAARTDKLYEMFIELLKDRKS